MLKLCLDLFGVKIETSFDEFERAVTVSWDQEFDDRQWELLEEIHAKGSVGIKAKGYAMSMGGDLEWIRSLRDAGIVWALPRDHVIEQAGMVVFSPLGKLVIDEIQKGH